MPLLRLADAPHEPAKTDQLALAATLTASEKNGWPDSFRISLKGKITLKLIWPETLRRRGLAVTATFTINGDEWPWAENALATKWRPAAAIASKGALVWQSAPNPEPSVTSVLREEPLALRLALLRCKSGQEGFYLEGSNRSVAANEASDQLDPDNVTTIAHLPTIGTGCALIRQTTSRTATDRQREGSRALEHAIRRCTPSAEKPAATTPTLQDAFKEARTAANEVGEAPLLEVRPPKATRHRSDKSPSGSMTESSSVHDIDESSAAHDTSAKGKLFFSLNQGLI